MVRLPVLLVFLVLVESFRSGYPEVMRYTVSAGDDSDRTPITVVQVSDLHFGRYRHVHRRSVHIIREINPDIIVITGDAVNAPSGLDELEMFLSELPDFARVFAIPGNWEYGELLSMDELAGVYRKEGARFLINTSEEFVKNDNHLRVSGLDDFLFGNPDYSIVDPRLEYHEIVMVHEPATSIKVPEGIETTPGKTVMAGHTHGGQITLFGRALYLPPGSAGYVKGLYNGAGKRLYVSRGIGSGFITLRVFARPDILVYSFK